MYATNIPKFTLRDMDAIWIMESHAHHIYVSWLNVEAGSRLGNLLRAVFFSASLFYLSCEHCRSKLNCEFSLALLQLIVLLAAYMIAENWVPGC